jgi:hypothetical protein
MARLLRLPVSMSMTGIPDSWYRDSMNLRWIVSCTVALLACSGGSTPAGDAGTTDGGQVMMGPCTASPGAGTSEACCQKYGSSACTTGNFCGSNGGGQTVCLTNCTQADLGACTADVDCASGKCNTTEGQCESSVGATCTPSIGCAQPNDMSAAGCGPAVETSFAYCDPSTKVCKSTLGQCKSDCTSSADCTSPTTQCTGDVDGGVGTCCNPDSSNPFYSRCPCP